MEDRDSQIAVIRAVVEDLHHRLFGNGNPGELAELRSRASSLEEFKNKILGALVIIATGITIIGTALFTHILKVH